MKLHSRATIVAALLYAALTSNCAVGEDGDVETDGTGGLPSGGARPVGEVGAGEGGMTTGQGGFGGAGVTSTSQSGTTVSSSSVGTTVSTTTVGTSTSATSTGITSSAISSGTGLPGGCMTSADCAGDPMGPCCLVGVMICGPDTGIPGTCL